MKYVWEKREFFNEIWVEYFDKTRWKQLLKKKLLSK